MTVKDVLDLVSENDNRPVTYQLGFGMDDGPIWFTSKELIPAMAYGHFKVQSIHPLTDETLAIQVAMLPERPVVETKEG